MAWVPLRLKRCQIVVILILTPVSLFLLLTSSSLFDPKPVIDHSYGLLRKTSPDSSYAIITLLTGNKNRDVVEEYFVSTRLLTYQLLVANETRCTRDNISFVVLVTSEVPQKQRERLSKDGAQILEAEDILLRWWIKTRYDRILYLDTDSFLTRPIDGIFNEPVVTTPTNTKFDRTSMIRGDEAPLPAQYIFAARSENGHAGRFKHPFPPSQTDRFNAGFWVIAPSDELFQYLMSVMNHFWRFNPHEMEQSLLNYALRRRGAMPWAELDYHWNANFVNDKDVEGGVAVLHSQLWKIGPESVQKHWHNWKERMERYYDELDI